MNDWMFLKSGGLTLGLLAATICAYLISVFIYNKAKRHPMAHPLIGSAVMVIGAITVLNISIDTYRQHVSLLAFMLGPATIALAIPLFNQFRVLIKMGWRVIVPICIGGTLAPLLAWLSIFAFDTPFNLQMTMLVKSITTPLAMGTAQSIGGIASLAAVFVIVTGIVGAIFAPWVFAITQTTSHMAQGVALGTVAHAVGTSKAISTSETCAAFATLAVCLNGIVTALLLPILFG
ncbi:LrgB family protein [Glaciecola siphonariae]|uniref:LrgB family protein n=1 Tax=Glaciecola siphonariae TaxID=521012 RepID=A0ABV9M2M8_9ALTE